MLCRDQILCISSGNLDVLEHNILSTVKSVCRGGEPCINKIPTLKKLRKAVFLKLDETAVLHNPVNSLKVWSSQRSM